MISLFQISPHDASIKYLGRVFGSVSGVIHSVDEQFGTINILSTMFKVFNGVVLTLAVLMLIYVTVVGVISTAQEGEFMGKKWNNIWIPLRAVLGFALLVPTGAGYCGLQIVMIWVIVQGIGAADVMWNTALSYINLLGTYPQIQIPSVSVQQPMNSLFQGLVCDAASKYNGQNFSEGQGSYFCVSKGGCSNTPLDFNPGSNNELKLGNQPGSCGAISIVASPGACSDATGATSLACMSKQSEVEALKAIVPTLSGIAMEMVKADYVYRDFYANSGSATQAKPEWDWIYQFCAKNGVADRSRCCHQTAAQRIAAMAGGAGGAGAKDCTSKLPPPDASAAAVDASSRAAAMYWEFYPGLGQRLGMNDSFVNSAIGRLMEGLQGAMTKYIAQQGQNINNSDMAGLAAQGWVLAGAYYFQLANQTGKKFSQALPNLQWTTPDLTSDMFRVYRNNFQAARHLVAATGARADIAPSSGSSENSCADMQVHPLSNVPSILGLGSADDAINEGFKNICTNLQTSTVEASSVGGGSNPLLWITALGQTLLWVATAIFAVLMILLGVLGLAGFFDVFVLGTGVDNPIGPTGSLYVVFLMPLLYGIMALLVGVGALLSVYVPLIPFIVFTFGVIHWLISAVEAMVAGPLVALGIISPNGQHEILGKAEPALMLLFNVFLRPSLMIFGLIAAMLLASVVQSFINSGFSVVMKSGGVAHDPVGLLVILCVYVMLVVAALNKCFSVINLLPSQVMRWIGGQAEQVETPLSEIKGASEAGAGQVKAGIGGMESSSKGASDMRLKQAEAQGKLGEMFAGKGGGKPGGGKGEEGKGGEGKGGGEAGGGGSKASGSSSESEGNESGE